MQMIHIRRDKINASANVRRLIEKSLFLFNYLKKMKTGYILIGFDGIFPIQSSEFIKSVNFGSNLIKTARKNHKKIHFSSKNKFL